MSKNLTNGNKPYFFGKSQDKARRIASRDDIDILLDKELKNEDPCCHNDFDPYFDKFAIKCTITKAGSTNTVTRLGIGSTENSAKFAAATRVLYALNQ